MKHQASVLLRPYTRASSPGKETIVSKRWGPGWTPAARDENIFPNCTIFSPKGRNPLSTQQVALLEGQTSSTAQRGEDGMAQTPQPSLLTTG